MGRPMHDQDWPDEWDPDLDVGEDQPVEEDALFQDEPADDDDEYVEEAYASYLDAGRSSPRPKFPWLPQTMTVPPQANLRWPLRLPRVPRLQARGHR